MSSGSYEFSQSEEFRCEIYWYTLAYKR